MGKTETFKFSYTVAVENLQNHIPECGGRA